MGAGGGVPGVTGPENNRLAVSNPLLTRCLTYLIFDESATRHLTEGTDDMAKYTHIRLTEDCYWHCPAQVTVLGRHCSRKAAARRAPKGSYLLPLWYRDGSRDPLIGEKLGTYKDGSTYYALATMA